MNDGSLRAVGILGHAAMVHVAHALRSTVAIPQVWKRSNESGKLTDEGYGSRLDKLGRLVVEMAARLRLEAQMLHASA